MTGNYFNNQSGTSKWQTGGSQLPGEYPSAKVEQEIKMFKTDSTKYKNKQDDVFLYEAYSYDQFSGTKVSSFSDRYYIWPDPWNLGYVPREGQELKDISRYNLYNLFVNKCFDITPNDPGNTQSFHLRLEQYAEIEKDGNDYRVKRRGKIQAIPTM